MIPNIATVTAEDAPLGVQLWPTITPKHAPNFTLERVEIVRSEIGIHVRWIYRNGERRVFALGELVAVDGDALGEWMADGLEPVYHRCGSALQSRPADGWDNVDMSGYAFFCPRCSVFTNMPGRA